MYSKQKCLKSEFFLFLIAFLGLFHIIGCGGNGKDNIIPEENQSDLFPKYTGNEEFTVAAGRAIDPLNGYRIDDPQNTLIPTSIDHSPYIPEVKSQGSTGSCTSWATGYYLKTYHEVIEEGWDKDINAFSPMYLFSMQCKQSEKPWNFLVAYNVLKCYGCAKWSTMPYEDFKLGDNYSEKAAYANVNITEDINAEAREYRCGENSVLENLSQAKQALTYAPILLGINNYASVPENASPENNYMRYDASNTNAGHAILCVGYDDSKFGVGALKFVNSWGITWGENGYSWIKYSDCSNIIIFAMAIKDIPNINSASANITEKPETPTYVIASDNEGPYVNITWNKVNTAKYYRIFKTTVGDPETHEAIGISYENKYRDHPQPGVTYYYSVVSVNEFGESQHYATGTEIKVYVDKGAAKGSYMAKPILTWTLNDSNNDSWFEVSDIDNTATSMNVIVSNASEGPWYSLGWISPRGFKIAWGDDSEYVGKQPFVKVRLCKADGYSEYSESAQVGSLIPSSVNVASIQSLIGSADNNSITLSWTTDGSSVDFFELWRYRAAEDEANDWILLDYSSSTQFSYDDILAIPGIPYYYAIFAIYQGTYSEPRITEDPIKISITQPNLYLYDFTYDYSYIKNNPVQFEVNVWNDGGIEITDYSMMILVYDWNDNEYYEISSVFNASDFATTGQLPLPSGSYHTLSFSFTIPSAYADGHFYIWKIWIDYSDTIDELYESDNYLESSYPWWAFPGSLKYKKAIIEKSDPTNNKVANTRPFSKKYNKNIRLKAMKENIGPIHYKRPSFCNNHAE